MDRTIAIAELEANFDQLVDEVATGTTLVITRDGVPVAKLVPAEPPARKIGLLAGVMPPIPDAAMFEPMSAEELAEWEHGAVFPVGSPQKRTRELDFLRDELPHVPDAAFFAPMTAEELAEWEDSRVFPVGSPTESVPPPKREFGFLKGLYPPVPDAVWFESDLTDAELDELENDVFDGPRYRSKTEGERPMGFLQGNVPDSFFEPLPEDELAAWEALRRPARLLTALS